MIPIAFDETKPLDMYWKAVDKLFSDIQVYLDKGYIGNRKDCKTSIAFQRAYTALNPENQEIFKSLFAKNEPVEEYEGPYLYSNYIIDGRTRTFLTWLLEHERYRVLLHKSSNAAMEFILLMDEYFPEYHDKNSQFYKNLYKIFVSIGYEKFIPEIKKEILHAIDTAVCPYCNTTFIRSKYKDGAIQGELDHFYPKTTYPFLAIFRYNLVPSCSMCNGHAGKSSIDTYRVGLVNPYTLTTDSGIIFRAYYKTCLITTLANLEENIQIKLDCSKDIRMIENKRIFHLDEIYQSMTDIAVEVFKKRRFFTSERYLNGALKYFNKGAAISSHDALRLFTGYFMSSKDFGKRPLSKFVHDLYMYPWKPII